MQNAEGLKPDQISEFLKASEGIDFVGQKRAEIYGWIQQVLVAQEYGRQSKKQRGSIRAYLSRSFHKYSPVLSELNCRLNYGMVGQVPLHAQNESLRDSLVFCRRGRTTEAGRQIYVTVFSGPARQDDLAGRRGLEQRRDCRSPRQPP